MRRWMIGIAMMLAGAWAPAGALAQQQTPIKVKAGRSWTHKPTGITLAPSLASFTRGDVIDLSGGQLLDVSIAYDDDASRTHVNVYLYHAAMPFSALWFDVASTMIATNKGFGTPTPEGRLTAFAPPGSDVTAGLRQSFAITERARSSGVALVALGDWVVKLRMTSGGLSPAQLDVAMETVMRQLGWPAQMPPLATATPIPACDKPIAFGLAAEPVAISGAAVLANAVMGNVAADEREKARKDGKAPEAPDLCIHPDRIAGRLPIYESRGMEAGYIIPIGDSGDILQVAKATMTGLIDRDAPPSWSVTMMKLDRWMQYHSYGSMPPPLQAMEIIRSQAPLSSSMIYGKEKRIDLSPDALSAK